MVALGISAFALALLCLISALLICVIQLFQHKHTLKPIIRSLARISFTFHSVSVVALILLQVMGNFQVAYVASVSNSAMPLTLKITALWGGQAGSLLFWSWIANLCLFIATFSSKKILDAWAFFVSSFNLLFFGITTFFISNPFAYVWELTDGSFKEALFRPEAGAVIAKVQEGLGLNPLLRHPAMVIHPPLLYLGYALFLIPFSVAVSKLVRRGSVESIIDATRSWTIAAWLMLSAGLALGSWWAYNVLGWGGYWAWDPVETASLLPWLASTGLLHSLLLQHKRHIFQRFNLILTCLSWSLVVFSIFITRSGLISSVHAFGDSPLALPFAAFTALSLLVPAVLIIRAWPAYKSEWEFNSPFSREALFLYTNVILIALVLVCLWGLLFPMITGVFSGTQVNLDKIYFQNVTGPLFIALVLLMAICPLLGWTAAGIKKLGKRLATPVIIALLLSAASYFFGVRAFLAFATLFIVFLGLAVLIAILIRDAKATGARKFPKLWWKQRARYGAYFVHAGILLIALGICGIELVSSHQQGVIQKGERMPVGEHFHLELVDLREAWTSPEYKTITAITNVYQDGVKVAELQPSQQFYADMNQTVGIPASYSTLRGDLYTQLISYDLQVPYIAITAADNPLASFLWIGAGLLVLGGCLASTLKPETDNANEHKTETTIKTQSAA